MKSTPPKKSAIKRKTPKVSVLTPLYNTRPDDLREMIDSILAQTFTDFEFIILNDSPENKELEKIVRSYRDPRIIFASNARNAGISESRNRLIDMARGEYLAIFDHDDISRPDRLALEVAYLDAHPRVGVVSGQSRYLGGREKPARRFRNPHDRWATNYPSENYDIKRELARGTLALVHSAALIRRSVLIDSGVRYEARFTPAEDYRLWARLMDRTEFHNLDAVAIDYRCHAGNTTHLQSGRMAAAFGEVMIAARNANAGMQAEARTKYVARLFGVIPLLKCEMRQGGRWTWLLFGFLPILKIKAG